MATLVKNKTGLLTDDIKRVKQERQEVEKIKISKDGRTKGKRYRLCIICKSLI